MQIAKNTTFCTKCGSENNRINSFCSSCGIELNKVKLEYKKNKELSIPSNLNVNISRPSINTQIDMDIDENDINSFVAKNIDFYENKFEKIKSTSSKITWNWAAFFLNIYWMLYRKMYLQAGAVLLLNAIIIYLPSGLTAILSLALQIGVGMYGNYMYLLHAQKKLKAMDNLDQNSKQYTIAKKGGTNIWIPIVVAVALIIIAFLLIMFVGSIFGMLYYY